MRLIALSVGLVVALLPIAAQAGPPHRVGTRSLGLGGSLRGAATGDSGPMLNPSGMSLVRAYTMEAAYQLDKEPADVSAHRGHVSIVDSTSSLGLGGGLYYTYLSSDLPAGRTRSGHEAGLSLSMPITPMVMVGATIKWQRLTTTLPSLDPMMDTENLDSGITTDLGATLRPIESLSVGLVGYNLIDPETAMAPLAFGAGAVFAPIPNFLIALDTMLDFQTSKLRTAGSPGGPEDKTLVSIMGGAEYLTEAQIAIRAGGGKDGIRDGGYLSIGASAVSQMGALDVGLRRDISGDLKQTIFAVSARLFVPSQ